MDVYRERLASRHQRIRKASTGMLVLFLQAAPSASVQHMLFCRCCHSPRPLHIQDLDYTVGLEGQVYHTMVSEGVFFVGLG
jgi:hypothetical protein